MEPALGKRTRDEGGAEDNDSTGPGDGKPLPSAAMRPQVQPSLSNVITATLQYAARKKLRPEQRNEVEVFLLGASINPSLSGSRISLKSPDPRKLHLADRPSYSYLSFRSKIRWTLFDQLRHLTSYLKN